MVLTEYAETAAPGRFTFQVHGTDISTGVLETARAAIYSEAMVRPVPEELRRKYMLRSKNPERRVARMTPAIRSQVRFRALNLLDADYGFEEPMDVVFCRNVMIYFDRATQQNVLAHISRTLRVDGYLFMGHSESLNGLELPLTPVAPTVYRRLHA
jgi:chemotaxis protein methyltransferase CheR